MQSLTSLLGGSGRYSQFVKLAGSGLWVPPSGVQLAHVAMAGAGGGGGVLGVGNPGIGLNLVNGGTLCSGGGGGYLEFDYPILGRASIAYSIGVGGAGAVGTVASGNTTGSGSSTANVINSSYYDAVWPVPSSMVTALQAAGVPVVLQLSASSASGSTTITFNASPATFGVAAGWSVGTSYRGGSVGTIASISGNTVTLTGTLSAQINSGSKLCMYSSVNAPGQLYIPSTGYLVGNLAILSSTAVVAFYLYSTAAPAAGSLVSGLSIVVSTPDYTGSNGTATTFGEYSAGGGYGSQSGGTVIAPGLQSVSLSSSSNFPYQTSGAALPGSAGASTSYYSSTNPGGRGGGGFMSAAYGVGAAGSGGSDGGPGGGGSSSAPTNSATPPPVGGKGGDGLLVILY